MGSGDQTQVSHVQGKCPNCCTIVPTPEATFFRKTLAFLTHRSRVNLILQLSELLHVLEMILFFGQELAINKKKKVILKCEGTEQCVSDDSSL